MSSDDMDTDSDSDNNEQRDFIAGKIVMVELENFLTHSAATVYPHELLNIVIGPNGTGKSSLVAAIIIGMGGSTKILSAQNKLSDYVKNGKERARVSITLYRDQNRRKKCFCREFGRDNKSVFSIDGRKTTEKQYTQEISDLNIQVGNLCQFLPQERVQDFAKQNPQELFLSTMKSVCSDESIALFDKLKELRNNQLNGTKNSDVIAESLRENQRRVELLEVQVAEIKRQDRLVEKRDNIKKKLAWMEFEEAFVECKEIDKDLKVARKTQEEAVKKKDILTQNIASVTKERQKYETFLTKETAKKVKTATELNRMSDEYDKLEETLVRAKCDFRSMEHASGEHQQNINENEMILTTYQKEYEDYEAKIGSVDEVKNQMQSHDAEAAEIRAAILLLEKSRSDLNSQIDGYVKPNLNRIENRIKSLQSVENAKLNFLRDSFGDTYQAVMWLRENQNRFRGRIYEPMILEINVKSNEYCKYIECSVAQRDLIAFTCEEAEDLNLFIKTLRVDMKLDINAVHSAEARHVRFKSRVPINEVRMYGGENFLIDTIEAPIPILNYLCQTYRIHEVLIGNEDIERKFESLPDILSVLFSPSHRIQIKRSRYSNQKSSMMTEIKSKNLLNVRISKRELAELENQRKQCIVQRDKLFNGRNEIESKINLMESQCKNIFKEKNEKQKLLYSLKEIGNKVKHQSDKVKRIKNQNVDIDAERENFKQNVHEIVKKMHKLHETAIKTYQTLKNNDLDEIKARARLTIFKNGTMNYEVQMMEANEEIERAIAYSDRIGRLLDDKKQLCKNKQVAALQLTDNHKPSEGDRFPYKKQFDELPNEKNVLLEEVEDLENQINCRTSEDQQTLKEYNDRLKNIERLTRQMSQAADESNELEQQMNKLHKKWHGRIAGMMETINENFSRFMNTMNCAGEVELIHPNIRDYDKYGIEIRVKYRNNEQLRPLDRFIQSGGERAVAIAIYSLSLQHLSQVPFRCVDEINQGMDPNNERRIFEMLVNNVAKAGQSQFFYVTPKLQPNMPFNENTSCLCVLNGAYSRERDPFECAE